MFVHFIILWLPTCVFVAEGLKEKVLGSHWAIVPKYIQWTTGPLIQLNQNFELPLFSVSTVVPFICCVHSCKPFVVITSYADLIDCRGFYSHTVGVQITYYFNCWVSKFWYLKTLIKYQSKKEFVHFIIERLSTWGSVAEELRDKV